MIIWNDIMDSHLSFMSGNQRYFQNQSCSVNIILCPILSRSIKFVFSQMGISLIPALVYYDTWTITVVKSFTVQAPGKLFPARRTKTSTLARCYTTFYGRNLQIFCNKLQWLSLAGLSSLAKYLWVKSGAYPCVEHLKSSSLRQASA